MTYGPNGPGPTNPQQPPSYGWPPPYPPQPTNKMATWSIVFAFLFAPVGAVLGHFALADIRDHHQRGRDRAVLGLALSYTFIAIAAGALLVAAIRPASPVTSITAAPTTSPRSPNTNTSRPTPTPTTQPTPTQPVLGQLDLPRLLLTLDEVKAITKTPKLASMDLSGGSGSAGGGSGAPGGPGDPGPPAPPCFDVITAGIDSAYSGTGFTGYKGAHFMDPSTATIVDEVVSTFDDAAAAQRFVGHVTDIWSRCSGQKVSLPTPAGSPSVALVIGTVTATTDGATLQNTLDGKSFTQYRSLALKDNVVVDLGAMGLQLTPDQPQAIQNQILARIPG